MKGGALVEGHPDYVPDKADAPLSETNVMPTTLLLS